QHQSPFFSRLPQEPRDEVYDYVFTASPPPDHPDPDEGLPVPLSSDIAAPRFTCRRMNHEARNIVFRDNIHILNWLDYRRSFARPGDFLNRMYNLEENLRREINRIAVYTPPRDVDELLDPLQIHYADRWSPVQKLEELRIILDIPRITSNGGRLSRVREENNVCWTVYHLRHVDQVVVQNIFYRNTNVFKGNASGRRWKVLMFDDDDERLNDDRHELVMTRFAP
ncbi:hypothetical protein GQ44DRAFT_612605, partial [Phaeosphaeriaceae sp. PMI808]